MALLLSLFVMMPIAKDVYVNAKNENVDPSSVESVSQFVETGLDGYRTYCTICTVCAPPP